MKLRSPMTRTRRRRASALTFGALLGIFIVGIMATPAYAAVTCTVTGSSPNEDIAVALQSGDVVTISLISGGNEIEIEPSADANCDGNDPADVSTISVTGVGGAESVTIDQSDAGGSFGSDIDFSLNLAGGTDSFVLVGDSGDDTIGFGVSGASLDAGATLDVTFTGVENKTANGNAGADTISGAGGGGLGAVADYALSITGGGDEDTLTGGTAADNIQGDGDDDFVNGGAGADTVGGGANLAPGDTLSYEGSPAGVVVDIDGTPVPTGGDAAGDILSGFENLTGSAFDDVLTGDANVNALSGGDGDDVLIGGDGADVLEGDANGPAGDTASYAASVAAVTVTVNGNTNTGGDAAGDDLSTLENLIGSPGNDSLTGDGGNNSLEGGLGNDAITGAGGTGDTASYAAAPSIVTVNLGNAAAQNTGGAGTDTIATTENVTGSAFNDVLSGDGGNNTITGLAGTDTADYTGTVGALTVNLSLAGAQATGGAGSDTLATMENLTGGSAGDTLTGDGGNNAIIGGDGDDTIQGAGGDDALTGGVGTDTATYAAASAGVTVSLGNAAAQNTGGAGTDTLDTFENLTGSGFDDTLTGNGGDNVLNGGAGVDTVSFGSSGTGVTASLASGTATGQGNDTLTAFENLTGSGGNDTLSGDAGNNALDGGAGTDTVSYAAAAGGVTVDLAGGTATGDGADTLTGFENVTGSANADDLTGNGGNNVLKGGAGNDAATGGGGVDTISGGDGKDDTAGGGGNDTLKGGAGADSASGGGGNDLVSGGGGNDDLTGGKGNDTIKGGDGKDTCSGGPGSDTISGCEN